MWGDDRGEVRRGATLFIHSLRPLIASAPPPPPPHNCHQAVNPRAIKNKVKIASSSKQPRYPVYEEGGRIVWIKPGQEALVFGSGGDEQAQQQQQPAELKITVSGA